MHLSSAARFRIASIECDTELIKELLGQSYGFNFVRGGSSGKKHAQFKGKSVAS